MPTEVPVLLYYNRYLFLYLCVEGTGEHARVAKQLWGRCLLHEV